MVKFWCQHSWEKPRNPVLDFLADNSEEKQTSGQFSGKRIKYLPKKCGPQKQKNLSKGVKERNLQIFTFLDLVWEVAWRQPLFLLFPLPRNQTDILYELMY